MKIRNRELFKKLFIKISNYLIKIELSKLGIKKTLLMQF